MTEMILENGKLKGKDQVKKIVYDWILRGMAKTVDRECQEKSNSKVREEFEDSSQVFQYLMGQVLQETHHQNPFMLEMENEEMQFDLTVNTMSYLSTPSTSQSYATNLIDLEMQILSESCFRNEPEMEPLPTPSPLRMEKPYTSKLQKTLKSIQFKKALISRNKAFYRLKNGILAHYSLNHHSKINFHGILTLKCEESNDHILVFRPLLKHSAAETITIGIDRIEELSVQYDLSIGLSCSLRYQDPTHGLRTITWSSCENSLTASIALALDESWHAYQSISE